MTDTLELSHWIGGEKVAGDRPGESHNPSDTRDIVARTPKGGAAEVDQLTWLSSRPVGVLTFNAIRKFLWLRITPQVQPLGQDLLQLVDRPALEEHVPVRARNFVFDQVKRDEFAIF